jgi:hypothetical protein
LLAAFTTNSAAPRHGRAAGEGRGPALLAGISGVTLMATAPPVRPSLGLTSMFVGCAVVAARAAARTVAAIAAAARMNRAIMTFSPCHV